MKFAEIKWHPALTIIMIVLFFVIIYRIVKKHDKKVPYTESAFIK